MSKILDPVVPKGGGSGNTKNRPNPAKHWCFTYCNWTDDTLKIFDKELRVLCKRFIYQKEIGEEGTPHLQGYLEFITKKRPLGAFTCKEIHWEKTKDKTKSKKFAIDYCLKEDTRVEGTVPVMFGIRRPKKIRTITHLYPWQQEIVNSVEYDCMDDRTIYWYWEAVGNTGKSALVKYLCVHHGAVVCSGKATDLKYLIVKYMEENDGCWPEILIFDIPRKYKDYVSYTGIEEIKNGCFCSTKYECGMVITNPPHILCFANSLPEVSAMSRDRWCIKEIGRSHEVTLSTSLGEVEELPA